MNIDMPKADNRDPEGQSSKSPHPCTKDFSCKNHSFYNFPKVWLKMGQTVNNFKNLTLKFKIYFLN